MSGRRGLHHGSGHLELAGLPRLFVASCLAGLLVAGHVAPSVAQSATPRSVVDDRGVAVSVPAEARRVAAISYFGADVALALGIKPVATTYMVRGRSPDFLLDHLDGVRQIGQRAAPNLELLAAAKPDVIVAMRRYTEANAAQYQKIAPYLAYDLELFGDSDRSITQLATILGKPERAAELNARFETDLADYAARAPRGVHPRFQVMWGGDTPWTFTSDNMTAAILTALGGENIAGKSAELHGPGRFGLEMSLETMLEKDPEVIFVYDYGPDRPHEGNPIWHMLSAVRNGRVHYVGDAWVEAHGPIAREIVLRQAAHFLYPDVFPMPEVRAEAARIIPAHVD
jgi:iron complex transport system substrate-binding protein